MHIAKLSNQEFCYWLQGYFEISQSLCFTKDKILLIENMLKQIHEPLGSYTKWLSDTIVFFREQNYRQELMNYFLPEISDRLNSIFFHVIDQSYESDLSLTERKLIHDGKTK